MLIVLLPLVASLLGAEHAATPRSAQVQLAEMLGGADAIHAIVPRRARAKRVDIALDRDGVAYRVTAKLRGTSVVGLTIEERGPATGEEGSLTWLAPELANATAIVRLAIDEDAAVTLTTDHGDRFMIIPGRGSGGNTAVEARWAAAWDSPDA